MDWVRRSHEHFARTGEPFLDGIDPAIEVYDHDIPDASNPYSGVNGIAKWLADFGESWDSYGCKSSGSSTLATRSSRSSASGQ